ncbi:hypothetical protein [Thalassotalea aquiviva]|uniref:hypothetical protein n=1 Tax=Thalassotalea aquiviva TaxID=3242415 RepID=UPI00352BA4C2
MISIIDFLRNIALLKWLCLLLLPHFALSASQPSLNKDFFGLGLEHKVPLQRNFDYEGFVLYGDKSLTEYLVLSAELGLFYSDVNDSDFTLNTQQLLIGYRLSWDSQFESQLLLGFRNERLEHNGIEFRDDNSDGSIIYRLANYYQLNEQHGLALILSNHSVYDVDRYEFDFNYRLRLNSPWYLNAGVKFSYNTQFKHDLNMYRLSVEYQF